MRSGAILGMDNGRIVCSPSAMEVFNCGGGIIKVTTSPIIATWVMVWVELKKSPRGEVAMAVFLRT